MKSVEIRQWLDRYQENLIPILTDNNYGCMYCENISCASNITCLKSEKYEHKDGILFNENYFELVSSLIVKDVKYTLQNCMEEDNAINFTILHSGRVTGGFGVWVVKRDCKYLDNLLKQGKVMEAVTIGLNPGIRQAW